MDALHVWQHIDDSAEAKAQVAFADVILLNKVDLVGALDLDRLERKIRSINAAARIIRCTDADVAMDAVLDVGGFDLSRAREVDPQFLEPEYPFESIGLYRLPVGRHELRLSPGPDPSIRVALYKANAISPDALAIATEEGVRAFSERVASLQAQTLEPDRRAIEIVVAEAMTVSIDIATGGWYALATQHLPAEFDLTVRVDGTEISPASCNTFKPNHAHDTSVSSVGIESARALDPEKFNAWLRELVAEKGTDIFRLKGVLNVAGHENRWVFQGIHMLIRGQADRPWRPDERRHSQLVFIGRHLDRAALEDGFARCLV